MLKRIRGTCHEGNVCPTLMLDTETNEVLVSGLVRDSITEAALRMPDGRGVGGVGKPWGIRSACRSACTRRASSTWQKGHLAPTELLKAKRPFKARRTG